MADNVTIPATGSGSATPIVATDDVGGAHHQRVKVDLGGDGASSPLVRGQQTKANSLPAVLASDQDALPVTDNGASLTVDGTVTANAGTGTFAVDQTDTAALDYDTGAGTVNQAVMGLALPASGGPVAGGTSTNPVRTDPTGTTTQPVSGTVSVTEPVSVDDNGGSLTVDARTSTTVPVAVTSTA
ncbi:MAG: hypothetical protein ACREGL_03280, partial [Alphaproteobacteria bacterium]